LLLSVFHRFKQREDRRQRYIAEAGGGKGREDFGLPGGDQFKKDFSIDHRLNIASTPNTDTVKIYKYLLPELDVS
jgi:hypothetical protein